MTVRSRFLPALTIVVALVPGAAAQQTTRGGDSAVESKGDSTASVTGDRRHLWSLGSSFGSVYDSNIERGATDSSDIGFVAGLRADYRTRELRPAFLVGYDVAIHRYVETERWNRVSHKLYGEFERRFRRRITFEAIAEASRNGSSEDRDLLDQLSFQPRLGLRLGGDRRLRAFAAQRVRRSPTSELEDATNRYVGASFEQRASGGGVWEASYRVETNEARGERFDYHRNTFDTEYGTSLSTRTRLTVGLKYRVQRYRSRFVEIEDEDFQRRDQRLTLSAELRFRADPATELGLDYEFEGRTSNDPSKKFSEHILSLVVTRRWF